jgi:hypothetical protein
MMGNYGDFDRIGASATSGPTLHIVSEIAAGSSDDIPRTMFQLFRGSYFGMWLNGTSLNQGRSFLRAVLAVTNASLTSTWIDNELGSTWRADRFLIGAHYGTALQDTFASLNTFSSRTTVILGDPLLRAHPLSTMTGLTNSKSGATVTLTWPVNTNATAGYRILRGDSTNAIGWQLLTELPAGTTNWQYIATNPSTNVYLIKAQAVKSTGSGAYTNTSLGRFTPTVVIP